MSLFLVLIWPKKWHGNEKAIFPSDKVAAKKGVKKGKKKGKKGHRKKGVIVVLDRHFS